MNAAQQVKDSYRVYIHAEGSDEFGLEEVHASALVADLLDEGEALWIQDDETPLAVDASLSEAGVADSSHLHKGRCRLVKAQVDFNAQKTLGEFGPATTIRKVLDWAVGPKGFDLPKGQIAKHELALPGSKDPLDEDLHIGSLVSSPRCVIELYLRPKDRPQG